jgi:hypothetical protein
MNIYHIMLLDFVNIGYSATDSIYSSSRKKRLSLIARRYADFALISFVTTKGNIRFYFFNLRFDFSNVDALTIIIMSR